VGYDPTLVGEVATKLLSDLALVVLLRNGLRRWRRQVLTYNDDLELVDLPTDALLIGWAHHDAATVAQLDALAKAQGCSVPELLLTRLRQARTKEAPSS
jgi:hypothetical protein